MADVFVATCAEDDGNEYRVRRKEYGKEKKVHGEDERLIRGERRVCVCVDGWLSDPLMTGLTRRRLHRCYR